jgi:hypothetical protein
MGRAPSGAACQVLNHCLCHIKRFGPVESSPTQPIGVVRIQFQATSLSAEVHEIAVLVIEVEVIVVIKIRDTRHRTMGDVLGVFPPVACCTILIKSGRRVRGRESGSPRPLKPHVHHINFKLMVSLSEIRLVWTVP